MLFAEQKALSRNNTLSVMVGSFVIRKLPSPMKISSGGKGHKPTTKIKFAAHHQRENAEPTNCARQVSHVAAPHQANVRHR